MRTIIIIVLAILPASALAACGGKPYEDAQAFVAAANAEGADLRLGPTLSTNNPEHDVYALEVGGGGGLAEEADEGGQAHLGGGSITVTESEDDARLEYEECESAATLLCYRAGNVALVLEGEITPAQRARIDAAIEALATD